MGIFEGFGKVPDDGLQDQQEKQELKDRTPQPPIQRKQEVWEDSAVSPDSTELKARKDAYEKYAKAVAGYEGIIADLNTAEQELRNTKQKIKTKDNEIKKIGERYDASDHTISLKLSEHETNRRNVMEELDLQRSFPDKAVLKFEQPSVDLSTADFFHSAFDRTLVGKNLREQSVLSVDEVCGPDHSVATIEELVSIEKRFGESESCNQLLNCIPTDDFIKKTISTITLGVTGLFFLFVLLGGFGIGAIAAVLKGLFWLLLFPIIGFLSYCILLPIAQGVLKLSESSVLAKVLAAVVGFGVISSALSGVAVSGIMRIMTSRTFWVRAVVGLIFSFFVYGISLGLISRKFVLDAIKKIPVTKTMMLKKLFAAYDTDEDFSRGVYCVMHHDEICAYFKRRHISDTIEKLEAALDDLNQVIASIQRDMRQNKDRRAAEIKNFEGQKAVLLRSADENARTLAFRQEERIQCLEDIKTWDEWEGASPRPDWIRENWFGDTICFTGTEGKDHLNMVKWYGIHSEKSGICVKYDSTGRDSVDVLCNTLLRIISVFDHIAPHQLLNYVVTDLDGSEAGEMYSYDLDWKFITDSSSGGAGKKTEGRINLVSTIKEINEYEKELEDYANKKNSFRNSSRAQIRKAPNGRIDMRELNAVRGSEPFRYQVVLIVPEYEDNMDDNFNTFKALYGVLRKLSNSFIPVFVIDKSRIVKKSWNSIVNDSMEEIRLKA